MVFPDSIVDGHKKQVLNAKIWSNVALGKLNEAILLSENRGRLGLTVEKKEEMNGLEITKINENSPAAHDHLKVGDIIVSFNDIPLDNIGPDSLYKLISALPREQERTCRLFVVHIMKVGISLLES